MSDLISVVSLNELEEIKAGNDSGCEFESSSVSISTERNTESESEFDEKSEEAKQKPDEGLSKTALAAYIFIGLLIVTGFYVILGFFIDYYRGIFWS